MRPLSSSGRPHAADKYPVSRRVLSRSAAALASIAAVLALPSAASAIMPPPRITEFCPARRSPTQPGDITAGPDGALWFTEEGVTPGIGRMTTSGDDPPSTPPASPPASRC